MHVLCIQIKHLHYIILNGWCIYERDAGDAEPLYALYGEMGGRESEMRRRFATIYDTSHRRVHIHLPFANAHRIYIYGIWICD